MEPKDEKMALAPHPSAAQRLRTVSADRPPERVRTGADDAQLQRQDPKAQLCHPFQDRFHRGTGAGADSKARM